MVAISTMTVYTSLFIGLIVTYAVWRVVMIIHRSRAATLIDEKTFVEGMRKAQIVDVREKKEFDAGHILGARNISYSTLKMYYKGLRKDIPIYLYDQSKVISTRAAIFLHKRGYNNISILKTGYNRWKGKTKKIN